MAHPCVTTDYSAMRERETEDLFTRNRYMLFPSFTRNKYMFFPSFTCDALV